MSLLCVKCIFLFDINREDGTQIPVEIVSNYLRKYLNCKEHFLSIAFSSSNDEQKYFQKDLISNMLKCAKLNNFTYRIMNEVYQYRKGNKIVFNVIFVDESASIL